MPATFDEVIQAIVQLCVLAVLLAVLADFLLFDRRRPVKQGKRSIVRTSTMLLFFLGYYLVIRWGWGVLEISSQVVRLALIVVGLMLLLLGALFNIMGRLKLSKNWGNNIKIYTDHVLITTRPFRLVRHPLYASLIWMSVGGALVYRNYLSLLLTVLIFIPFMAFRARQEEAMLKDEFPEYPAYRSNTGMFFPRIWKKRKGLDKSG